MKRALDLFSGAGGAARGLQQAGYYVTGVDNREQPRYAGDRFILDDAMAWLRGERESLDSFDLIWASPPCQGYSRMRHLPWLTVREYPMLIPDARRLLTAWGGDWIIENVEGAPMENGVTLCGQMFGLKVYRHRRFESNILLLAPPHRKHTVVIASGSTFNARQKGNQDGFVSLVGKDPRGGAAMGIDWMSRDELSQAIPPAYSRFLAEQITLAAQPPTSI